MPHWVPLPPEIVEKIMINSAFRLFILVILAIAAIAIFFFVLHIVFRLLILGAIALVVIWIARNWKRGNGE